jgi:hypothetical protein
MATKKSGAERQAEYERRLRADGYCRVQVWVPAGQVDRLKKFASRLKR